MAHLKKYTPKKLGCVITISLCIISSSVLSLSRMGTASIFESEGLPCFSIPENTETENGVPLDGLFVSELPSADRNKLPLSVWSFRAHEDEESPRIFPKHCIVYGETPSGTTQRTLRPLQLLKVYSVFIRAAHDGSSMMGYSGEFCIKPAGSGRTAVHVISQDASLGESRYQGCTK